MKEDSAGNGRASVEHSQAAQLPPVGGDLKDALSENQLDSFAFGNATDAGDRTLKATKLRYTCLFFGTIFFIVYDIFSEAYTWCSNYQTAIAAGFLVILLSLTIATGILVVCFTSPKPTGMFSSLDHVKADR